MRRAQLAELVLGILAEAAPRDVAFAQREQVGQRRRGRRPGARSGAPCRRSSRACRRTCGSSPSPTTRSRSALDSFSRRQIASAISAPTYSCLKKLYSPGAPSRGWRARGLPTSCSSAPSRTIGVALRVVHHAPACARRRRACGSGSGCSRRPRAAPGSPRRAGRSSRISSRPARRPRRRQHLSSSSRIRSAETLRNTSSVGGIARQRRRIDRRTPAAPPAAPRASGAGRPRGSAPADRRPRGSACAPRSPRPSKGSVSAIVERIVGDGVHREVAPRSDPRPATSRR